MQFSDGSMMEHHDDWTKEDDELENETRKWTGITEFSNRNEDRNASEEVQEAFPDDPEQLRETQPARGLPVPRQPNQHEREQHELTHLPFRAWCKTCVAAKARQAYHTKQPDRRDCLQLDFGFLTEGNRQDAQTERCIQTLWAQLRTLRTQIGDKYSKFQITDDSFDCRLGHSTCFLDSVT